MSTQSFALHVADADLEDLNNRLSRTRRLPDTPRRPPSGMTAEYLDVLIRSWTTLDWRSRKGWLNAHPQFLADIGGDTVNFAHLRSAFPDAPAVLVMHGWPHTFALQLDLPTCSTISTSCCRACPASRSRRRTPTGRSPSAALLRR